jgi:hypothetical protein
MMMWHGLTIVGDFSLFDQHIKNKGNTMPELICLAAKTGLCWQAQHLPTTLGQ